MTQPGLAANCGGLHSSAPVHARWDRGGRRSTGQENGGSGHTYPSGRIPAPHQAVSDVTGQLRGRPCSMARHMQGNWEVRQVGAGGQDVQCRVGRWTPAKRIRRGPPARSPPSPPCYRHARGRARPKSPGWRGGTRRFRPPSKAAGDALNARRRPWLWPRRAAYAKAFACGRADRFLHDGQVQLPRRERPGQIRRRPTQKG